MTTDVDIDIAVSLFHSSLQAHMESPVAFLLPTVPGFDDSRVGNLDKFIARETIHIQIEQAGKTGHVIFAKHSLCPLVGVTAKLVPSPRSEKAHTHPSDPSRDGIPQLEP